MNIILNEVKNKKIVIDIFGSIGESFFEDGFTVQKLRDQLEGMEFDTIEINIQSMGGSAYEAINIFELLNFYKSKGIKIITRVVGLCASAGSTILSAGNERIMSNIGMILVHFASINAGGKKEDIENDLEVINKVNENLLDIYTEVTGKDREDLRNLLNEDRWMDAKEAKKWGFLTKITNNKSLITKVEMNELVNKVNDSNLPKINIENMESIINQINESDHLPKIEQEVITETIENNEEVTNVTEVTNEVITEVNNEVVEPINKVEEVIEPIINKVEDTIVDKVEDIENIKDIDNLKLEINTKNDQILNLSNQVDTLSIKIKELEKTIKDKEIEDILNVAIKQNKISNSLKENYKNLLNVDFELTSQLISKLIPNKVVSLVDLITEEESTNPRIDWTIRDWEKQDPNGLREMKSNDPEKYNKLFNSFYKK